MNKDVGGVNQIYGAWDRTEWEALYISTEKQYGRNQDAINRQKPKERSLRYW